LPILLAVRERFHLVLDKETKNIFDVSYFFDKNCYLTEEIKQELLKFFKES
jgi:hypothetical protein